MPLWVVATPIGNLKDLSERAKEVLRKADLLLCESVERARILYKELGVRMPRFLPVSAPREKSVVPRVMEELERGKNVVLISSAGTPAVQDPGSHIVREALKRGFQVIPVPGPSACTTAMSVAGMSSRFLFAGFPPKKGKESFFRSIKDAVEKLDFPTAVVIYENPHQLSKTLDTILRVFGDVEVLFAREMTKMHEEILRMRVSELISNILEKEVRGEITLVIWPYSERELEENPDEAF